MNNGNMVVTVRNVGAKNYCSTKCTLGERKSKLLINNLVASTLDEMTEGVKREHIQKSIHNIYFKIEK